jgi:hypothetical protein
MVLSLISLLHIIYFGTMVSFFHKSMRHPLDMLSYGKFALFGLSFHWLSSSLDMLSFQQICFIGFLISLALFISLSSFTPIDRL